MATPKNNKHKEYAHDGAHCLEMVAAAKDQDSRAIQSEMTAEWLKLAMLFCIH
jgi:prephenate dehydratase